jgi:hypothetical protein
MARSASRLCGRGRSKLWGEYLGLLIGTVGIGAKVLDQFGEAAGGCGSGDAENTPITEGSQDSKRSFLWKVCGKSIGANYVAPDVLRDLRHDGVSERGNSVHPMGNPIYQSSHCGFNRPCVPSPSIA